MVLSFLLSVLLVVSAVTYGQEADKPLASEAADVRVSSQHLISDMTGNTLRNGRYTLQNATMLDLIRVAYETEDDRILGGADLA